MHAAVAVVEHPGRELPNGERATQCLDGDGSVEFHRDERSHHALHHAWCENRFAEHLQNRSHCERDHTGEEPGHRAGASLSLAHDPAQDLRIGACGASPAWIRVPGNVQQHVEVASAPRRRTASTINAGLIWRPMGPRPQPPPRARIATGAVTRSLPAGGRRCRVGRADAGLVVVRVAGYAFSSSSMRRRARRMTFGSAPYASPARPRVRQRWDPLRAAAVLLHRVAFTALSRARIIIGPNRRRYALSSLLRPLLFRDAVKRLDTRGNR
jgi:hypothetical protein